MRARNVGIVAVGIAALLTLRSIASSCVRAKYKIGLTELNRGMVCVVIINSFLATDWHRLARKFFIT
jgi:hypothetical protein